MNHDPFLRGPCCYNYFQSSRRDRAAGRCGTPWRRPSRTWHHPWKRLNLSVAQSFPPQIRPPALRASVEIACHSLPREGTLLYFVVLCSVCTSFISRLLGGRDPVTRPRNGKSLGVDQDSDSSPPPISTSSSPPQLSSSPSFTQLRSVAKVIACYICQVRFSELYLVRTQSGTAFALSLYFMGSVSRCLGKLVKLLELT